MERAECCLFNQQALLLRPQDHPTTTVETGPEISSKTDSLILRHLLSPEPNQYQTLLLNAMIQMTTTS
jgi:hypothetical protein